MLKTMAWGKALNRLGRCGVLHLAIGAVGATGAWGLKEAVGTIRAAGAGVVVSLEPAKGWGWPWA